MSYPPRTGRSPAPAAPTLVKGRPDVRGPLQRLTPRQAAALPRGTRFVGLDGVARIRR